MIHFNPFYFAILLLCSIIPPLVNPSWFFDTYRLYHVTVAISFILGFRIIVTSLKSTVLGKHYKFVYNTCKLAFIYLLLLSALFVINSYSSESSSQRNIREQLVYMMLYGWFFVFIANIILDIKFYSKSMYKLICIYIYIFYITFNIIHLLFYGSISHNAYLACLGLIILSNAFYGLLHKRNTVGMKALYILFIIVLVTMPILAVLRGATLTMILIVFLQLLFLRRNKIRNIILIIVIIVSSVFVMATKTFKDYFEDLDMYEYTRPTDMLRSVSQNDPNKNVRLSWYADAVNTALSSPLSGSIFQYEFSPFGTYYSSAAMLHNYYLSMLADTGFIIAIFHIFILIIALKHAIRNIMDGNAESIKFLSWNIAIISTYYTNCWGNIPHTSVVMALIQAYAIVRLIRPHPISKTPNTSNKCKPIEK